MQLHRRAQLTLFESSIHCVPPYVFVAVRYFAHTSDTTKNQVADAYVSMTPLLLIILR